VLMPRNCQSLARLFTCFLGVRSFFPAGSTPPDALDPIEQRRRGFAAFKELLGRLAEQSTLILYLDDLQWGDADSAHLLEDLLRPPDAPPMLLLTCSRIEGTASESYHRALDALRTARNDSEVRSIALEPLQAADAEALAVALLEADDTATQGWAAAIARESEGHPYLLKELCRYSESRRECRCIGRVGSDSRRGAPRAHPKASGGSVSPARDRGDGGRPAGRIRRGRRSRRDRRRPILRARVAATRAPRSHVALRRRAFAGAVSRSDPRGVRALAASGAGARGARAPRCCARGVGPGRRAGARRPPCRCRRARQGGEVRCRRGSESCRIPRVRERR
ncbi:MAG: hypothetical protein E6J62_21320, partial [Deltaproteobacteria bacterium]